MMELLDEVKANSVHKITFGAQVLPDGRGTCFRFWAPSAQSVELVINEQAHAMQADGDGWLSTTVSDAGHGTLYQYRINQELLVPDPASRFQPDDVHGPSQVIDPNRFEWQDLQWRGKPWNEVILYELHVGTFTLEGTFAGVQNKLDYLLDLGVTAIELMPVADFPGRYNWGYDGVLPFAPDSAYGTPDDLKRLIQAAHQKGLMVFLDVVYNHFGPEGNYLHAYAEPFFTGRHHTPWGGALNVEGAKPVREFFIQNALYWLNEYRLDGLRFDAVHEIYDQSEPHFLQELASVIRAETDSERLIHLVLENDDNAACLLSGKADKLETHFNAQWNDDFHHAAHVICTGDVEGYYTDYSTTDSFASPWMHLGRCLAEGFGYQGEASPYRQGKRRGEKSDHLPLIAFVNFLQNHDQIGNRALGERLISLASPKAVKAMLEILLLAPATPMLFMGEEWGTEKPFLFFCDFNEELASLVREGRRREFSHFNALHPDVQIPDPVSVETFNASMLDWQEKDQWEHLNWLTLYKQLLALRKKEIIPRLHRLLPGAATFEVMEQSGLQVDWRLDDDSVLRLIANLGDSAIPCDLEKVPSVLFYSNDETWPNVLKAGSLLPWSVAWGMM